MTRLNFIRKTSFRGQTALETFFVFSALIFAAFAMLNLNTNLFTKNIATYAAFMGARSYQVYGDHRSILAELPEELIPKEVTPDGGVQNLLENENALSIVRTAEDIFTCALPWYGVPDGDADGELFALEQDNSAFARCREGQRKYERTNINRRISMFRFDRETSPQLAQANDGALLERVADSFAEEGREPIRYAILKLQYKNRLLFNVLNAFDGPAPTRVNGEIVVRNVNDNFRQRQWHSVHVPVLLNAGLHSGVRLAEPGEENPNVDENVPLDEDENEIR